LHRIEKIYQVNNASTPIAPDVGEGDAAIPGTLIRPTIYIYFCLPKLAPGSSIKPA